MLPGLISGGFFGAVVSDIINSGSVSGGAITFTGLDLSAYYMVRVYLSGIEVNADDNSIAVQLEIGGALVTSGYQYIYSGNRATTSFGNGSSSAAHINLHNDAASEGIGNAAGESLSGFFDVGNFESGLHKYVVGHMSHLKPAATLPYTSISGRLTDSGDITGFKIICTDGGGSLTAGRAFVVGLA